MEISITDAKAKLTDLVRKAEEGEEVILTRHGKPVARAPRRKADADLRRAKGGLGRDYGLWQGQGDARAVSCAQPGLFV